MTTQEKPHQEQRAPEEEQTTLPAVADERIPIAAAQDHPIQALEREAKLYEQGSSPTRAARDEYTLKFPEQRLDEITTSLHELAVIAPRVTFGLFQSSPEEFREVLERAEALLASIEGQLATLEIVTKTENPLVSFFQRMIVAARLLLRGSVNEARLLQVLQSNARRDTMLQGVEQLRGLLRANAEKIVAARAQIKEHEDAQLITIYHSLEQEDKTLQNLRARERTMQSDLKVLEVMDYKNAHEAAIRSLSERYFTGRDETKKRVIVYYQRPGLEEITGTSSSDLHTELIAYLKQEIANNLSQQQERSGALMAEARKRMAEKT